MLPSYAPWFSAFRTVFVFAQQPFLPMWVLLVSDFEFYIVITMVVKFDFVITFDWGSN